MLGPSYLLKETCSSKKHLAHMAKHKHGHWTHTDKHDMQHGNKTQQCHAAHGGLTDQQDAQQFRRVTCVMHECASHKANPEPTKCCAGVNILHTHKENSKRRKRNAKQLCVQAYTFRNFTSVATHIPGPWAQTDKYDMHRDSDSHSKQACKAKLLNRLNMLAKCLEHSTHAGTIKQGNQMHKS